MGVDPIIGPVSDGAGALAGSRHGFLEGLMRMGAIFGRGVVATSILVLIAALAVQAQSASSTNQQQSFRPPAGALVAPGESPQLTLLYTGNVVGYLDPCG